MRLPHWKEIGRCCPVLVLLLFALLAGFTGCEGTTMPGSPIPTQLVGTTPEYISALKHLTISVDHLWQMGQSNSLTANVSEIDKPLILAVELTPQFTEEPVSQKPVVLEGTPVVGYKEEITGYLVVYRVNPETNSVQIVFPATLFNSALYVAGGELVGWELQVALTSQIDAYPVPRGKSLGKRYPITTQDVQSQQTWIESEAESQSTVGSPTDVHLVVPNSTSGLFLYYSLDEIVDSIIITSDLTFNFKVRG